jgi:hypothetical protein
MTTTQITPKALDDALLREAIPAVGWHILNLQFGFSDTKTKHSTEEIANHYKVDTDLIDAIAEATLSVVQRSQ